MPSRFNIFAIAAVLAAGTSSVAMAQYGCPAGYAFYNGVCQPAAGYAPSNPVSGAAAGAATGAATGAAVGGPVGAVVGGAIGTATGAAAGTVNAATGAPVYGSSYPPPAPAPTACPYGTYWYNGACYRR